MLFGGKALEGHNIPACYGAIEPTAVYVPLVHFTNKEHRQLLLTECFAPFQLVTEYEDSQLEAVLGVFEGMSHHLTAAVVSNDTCF